MSLKCDEVTIMDSSKEFNEDTVIYYKKYANYRIYMLLNVNLIKIDRYFKELFDKKVYQANDKHKLSKLIQTMKIAEIKKSASE